MQRSSGWVAAAALVILGGCVDSDVAEPEVTIQAIGTGGPCPEAGCGENSPVIDALGFHELNVLGVLNTEGYWLPTVNGHAQIVKMQNSVLTSYDLNVVNGRIFGNNSATVLSGQDLVGATIAVNRLHAKYTLRIRDVRKMQYFLEPRTTAVEAYELQWAKDGDDNFQNLCGGVQLLLNEGLGAGGKYHPEIMMRMTVWEAVVFEGDRINTALKTMSKTANDAWFNIGCAASTPAKLLLTHHTIHSQDPQPRAWERRQATLKMYVADYCGDGGSFTVARQKMVWMSKTVPYLIQPWKLEARWTERGAQCLNNPRMLYPSTPLGSVYFPNIGAALAAASCNPPSCANLDPNDLDNADRVSSNPLP